MGYSHYWYWGNRVPKSKMAAVAADLQILRPRLEREMGVRLAGVQGKGEAEITDKRIRFNGPADCGHPRDDGVVIPWPSARAKGVQDESGAAKAGYWPFGTLLSARSCDGNCSSQTFLLDPREGMRFDNCQGLFNSCMTRYAPYDLAVTACLLVAKHHFGTHIRVETNGESKDWADASRIISEELGYGREAVVRYNGRVLYKPVEKPLEVAA